MKFFVDTANLDEIKKAQEFGVLDGVTTNPSLMAKIGIKGQDKILAHYKAICDVVDDNVSAEVISTDFDGIMKEAHDLAKIDKKIVVKVPMIPDGIKAIKVLSEEGIRTNCTLIFSPTQAILAAKAGASYVSPFIGRLDDISMDGLQLIADLVTIFSKSAPAALMGWPCILTWCSKLSPESVNAPLPIIVSPIIRVGLSSSC